MADASGRTKAEVTEFSKELYGGKVLRLDEISTEYFRALESVGLLWLTNLFKITWRLGTVSLDWQTGVGAPLHNRRGRGGRPTIEGSNFSVSLRGPMTGCWRGWLIAEPRLQEEQCGLLSSCGTLDQLFTLYRVLRGVKSGGCSWSTELGALY